MDVVSLRLKPSERLLALTGAGGVCYPERYPLKLRQQS